MAKLTDEELQEIVQRDLPGRRVVRRASRFAADAARDAASNAEAQAPSLADLRRKYLGEEDGGITPDFAALDAGHTNNTDDEIVVTSSAQGSDPWRRGAGPKAAVVSGSERKVIGAQG